MTDHSLPSISLCMIVKNEEVRLRDCLASAKSIVSEMIVVDTGSSDRSVDIAQEMGALVFHHPWEGNFSSARNHSLNYASSDWILILDGDEILDPSSLLHLQQIDFDHTDTEAFTFEIVNFTSDLAIKTEAGLLDQVRLFKNSPHHRYDGCVHNQLINLKTQEPLSQGKTKVQVLHYGYTPEVWAAQNKDDRIVLHERAIAEDPHNHFIRFNYANHLKILKRYEEALEQFILAIPPRSIFAGLSHEDCLEMTEFNWGTSACFLGAFCANKLGAHDIALELCNEALERRPWLIDARLRGAEAYLALEQYDAAIQLLEPALQRDSIEVLKLKALHFDAPYRLGRALFLSQRPAQAAATFTSLLPHCRDITVLTHLCLCACALGLPELWHYARQRGDDLDSQDPDWAVIDQQIAKANASKHSEFPQCELLVYALDKFDDKKVQLEAWCQHLRLGLAQFNSIQGISLRTLETDHHYLNLQDLSGQSHLVLDIKHDEARLCLAQFGEAGTHEVLYRLPERYQDLSLAKPKESAALLLAHLKFLHS